MFELVRKFRQWIMIGGIVLVTFAFGITGVVVSVLSPSRNPRDEEIGSFSVSSVTSSEERVSVTRREFDNFQRRWEQFFIDRLSIPDMLFGRAANQPQRMTRMYLQMALRRSVRNDPFVGFLLFMQQRMGVDLIQNLLFLRSSDPASGSDSLSLLPELNQKEFEQLDDQRKKSIRRRRWRLESIWRLMYVYHLARRSGFSATDAEIEEMVLPYLKRSNQRGQARMSYRDFVSRRAGMSVERFEKTFKELLTIMKYLGSLSQLSAVETADLTSGFNEDNGYGKLLVANLSHDTVRSKVFSDWNWRVRQRFYADRTTKQLTQELSNFVSNQGGGRSPAQPNAPSGSSFSDQMEKRQFAYLSVPIDPYRDQVEEPTDEEIQSHYEENKEQFKVDSSSDEAAKQTGGEPSGDDQTSTDGEGKGENGTSEDQYRPLEEVRDRIRQTIVDRRAKQKADAALQQFRDTTIVEKEIRGETVDFQKLARSDHLQGRLQYQTSPLLDRKDMKYWLNEIKGASSSHRQKIIQFVFEQSLGENDTPGPYPEETMWFSDAVVLPRLIRIHGQQTVPSVVRSSVSNGTAGRRDLVLSEFKSSYPIWSQELKRTLQWRALDQETTNRAKEIRTRIENQYRSLRDQSWKEVEFIGPPMIPGQWIAGSSDPSEEQRGSDEKPLTGPPGLFRREHIEQSILYKREKWKRAKSTFHEVSGRHGLEVQESGLFNLENGPSELDLLSGIRQQLQGSPGGRRRRSSSANLYEPLSASDEERSQVAILVVKLPKSGNDLETFVNDQRMGTLRSSRNQYLKNNLSVFIENADLSLKTSPPGPTRSDTEDKGTKEETS